MRVLFRMRRDTGMIGTTHAVREGDMYRTLMEQVIAGNGLSAIARAVSDALGLPATIGDEEYEPLHGFAPRGRNLSTEEAALPAEVRDGLKFDLESAPRASTAPPT